MKNNISITEAILSLDEARALGKPVPYSYVLGTDTKKIFVFGAKHSWSPEDAEFVLLKELWAQFTALPNQKIAFVEQGKISISETFEDAIQLSGEGGAMMWLAKHDDVGVVMADIGFEENAKLLSEKFGPAKVAYYYITQTMWNRARRGETIPTDRIDKVIKGNQSTFEPLGLMIDRTWFNAENKKIFPDQQLDDMFWKEFWKHVKAAGSLASFMHEITSESARIRNIRALELFQKYWDDGYSVFATYGANHSWEWEPALRKLTE